MKSVLIHSQKKSLRAQFLQTVREEVQVRREQSLHQAVLRNFQAESELTPSWDIDIKIGNHPSVALAKDIKIWELFDRIDGKMMLLGSEGSGKTTTLLELAEVLIHRAEKSNDYPLPLFLNLSSWYPEKGSISDWLLGELQGRYSIPFETGNLWLKEGKLLPLLDGFEEIYPELQETCLHSINSLIDAKLVNYIVVSSDFNAYKKSKFRLRLRAAIWLKPFTKEQIQAYLMGAKSRELWYNLEEDANLLTLAKTPFFLSMMTLAYEEILMASWKRLESFEEQKSYLLNAYIRRQLLHEITNFYPPGKEPRPETVRYWLMVLAERMKQQGNDLFSIDDISPLWFRTPEQLQIYRRGSQLVTGLVWGTITGVLVGLFLNIWLGLIAGLIGGVIIGIGVKEKNLDFLILRFLLWKYGEIPWNYRRFLEDATQRLLLQKVGHRYQFIHPILQNYFAQLD